MPRSPGRARAAAEQPRGERGSASGRRALADRRPRSRLRGARRVLRRRARGAARVAERPDHLPPRRDDARVAAAVHADAVPDPLRGGLRRLRADGTPLGAAGAALASGPLLVLAAPPSALVLAPLGGFPLVSLGVPRPLGGPPAPAFGGVGALAVIFAVRIPRVAGAAVAFPGGAFADGRWTRWFPWL